jgi:thiamine biosynthesis protein ThiC
MNMKTQLELAREGVITPLMETVAGDEGFAPETIRARVAAGEEIRKSRSPENARACTMCGSCCAMERGISLFEKDIKGDKISIAG